VTSSESLAAGEDDDGIAAAAISAADSPTPGATRARGVLDGEEQRDYDVGRVLALSDGVFAIAMTLLVLSLRVPDDVTPATLGDALRNDGAELFAYALTVLVIGAFWLGHHGLFNRIERVDGRLMWLNVLYLGLIALLPFPTDMLGRFGGTTAAVMIYAAAVGLTSVVVAAIDVYAAHAGLLRPTPDDPEGGKIPDLPVGLVFLATVPVAWWNPQLAMWLWLLALPWGWLGGHRRRRRRQQAATGRVELQR
jgi:uncharacterized membrane protein